MVLGERCRQACAAAVGGCGVKTSGMRLHSALRSCSAHAVGPSPAPPSFLTAVVRGGGGGGAHAKQVGEGGVGERAAGNNEGARAECKVQKKECGQNIRGEKFKKLEERTFSRRFVLCSSGRG